MLKPDIFLDEAIFLFYLLDVLPDLWSCRVIPRPWLRSPIELVHHTRNVASTPRVSVLVPMSLSVLSDMETIDRPCAADIFVLLITDNLDVLQFLFSPLHKVET